ncbi:MAG: RnfABCDGE type electron transport complex subunit D [Desulfosalsimonadaceae bacterium]
MPESIKLTVSHAPFWHSGSQISLKNYNILLATLLAVIPGLFQYGLAALALVALSIASAMIWELIMNFLTRRPVSIGDGNAALLGMLFAMMLPAVTPWWVVVVGTLFMVVIGKQIFGGLGGNPFNPVAFAFAVLLISWPGFLDFNKALVNYQFDFNPVFPLLLAKSFGSAAVEGFSAADLLLGRQVGGIGTSCALGLIIGGIYLMLRGYIRWEIALSFIAGMFITAFVFHQANPQVYAGAGFHVLTGYSLLGAFFLATDDSSSPVNFIPMLLYGALGGFLTVLIRNIGTHIDGVVFAILLINLINPIIDKIRPKTLRKVINYA